MPVTNEKTNRLERLLFAMLAVASLVFVFVGIGRVMWLDEAFCALAARQSAAGIIETLRNDNSMPLYYFLLAGWVRLFGDSEIALRLLSGLFYLGGGLVAGMLGRRLGQGSARAGGYGALFYLCSMQAIHQAQSVRMYSLLGLLAGVSLLLFLRLFFDDGRRWWVLYFVVNTIGVMTQHWFVFVLFAQFVVLVVWRRERLLKFTLLAVGAGAPFLAVWSPILIDQMRNGSSKWIPSFRAWFISDAFTRFYGGYPALFLFGFVAVVLMKVEPEVRRALLLRRVVQVAALAFVLCVAVPLVVSVARPLYWPDRYTIIALAPLAALLGLVFAEAAPRPVAMAVGVLLLSFQVWFQFATRDQVTFDEVSAGLSDRATARYLVEHASAGDAVVFTSMNRAVADYYFHRVGAEGRFREYSYPAETARHLGWEDMPGMLAQPGRLQGEAERLAAALRAGGAGRRVWLYYRDAYPPSEILRQRLTPALTFEREQAARGAFHTRLLIYRVP